MNFTKYNSNGDSSWTVQIKDDTSDYQLNYLLADSLGNFYAALNQTWGLIESQVAIMKLNQNGNIIWTRILQTESVRKMIIDLNSNLIVETLGDGLTIKYTSTGDSLWTYESNSLLTD